MSVHCFKRYVTHGTTGVSNPVDEVVFAESTKEYVFDEDEERPVHRRCNCDQLYFVNHSYPTKVCPLHSSLHPSNSNACDCFMRPRCYEQQLLCDCHHEFLFISSERVQELMNQAQRQLRRPAVPSDRRKGKCTKMRIR